ncbi:MAG TPA: hypothetical protein VFY93_06460 [Planctomycetota bacterium]|nr:hypothetical protein [Planctomycetota bacterium]
MKPYQLAVVLLRVYALTLVVHGISAAMGVIPLFWSSAEETMAGSSMSVRAWGVVDGVIILCVLGIAALLLFRTDLIARFVCRGLPGGAGISVDARDLAILGFSILGIYCFIDGAPGLAYRIVRWRTGYEFDLSRYFVADAVETVLGLLLFVTPHGFVRLAQWLRRAGAPEPAGPTTPPA